VPTNLRHHDSRTSIGSERIDESAWQDAIDMHGAQVAETTYNPGGWKHEPLRLIIRRVPFSAEQIAKLKGSRRLKTIHPEQLQLALDGTIASVYGYSFIVCDIPASEMSTAQVEDPHRHRAQIEERLKESKLGQALRRLPSASEHANRVWLTAALLALNLTAFCCDLCPAAGASGKAPHNAPLRRAAKTLRNLFFCIPARIVRTGRQLLLRPAAGSPTATSSPPRSTRSTRSGPDTHGVPLRFTPPLHRHPAWRQPRLPRLR
jgi:hypothetical protein